MLVLADNAVALSCHCFEFFYERFIHILAQTLVIGIFDRNEYINPNQCDEGRTDRLFYFPRSFGKGLVSFPKLGDSYRKEFLDTFEIIHFKDL